MRTGRPKHLKAFDYVGFHRYFLTLCTFERRTYFTSLEPVTCVRTQIERAAGNEGFAIVAYCFMPDHLHLLIEGVREDAECRRFIRRAKQLAGFHFKNETGEPLWQRYGYEHVLRSGDATLSVARYIVENPLRASLVSRPQDYPYLGSNRHPLAEILEAIQLRPGWSG